MTSITIPDGITTIGENVFFLCQNLQYNEFDNAKYLGNAGNKYLVLVTAKSTNITSCSINVKCTFVLNKAFRGCSGLISITIPDSVKSIGQYAFRGCSGLTSVTIGNSVTSIGLYAFSGCDGLTEIHYNGDLTGWFKISGIYSLMSYGKSTKTLYVGGTKIEGDLVIPEGVKYIGSYAFSGCSDLTSITIPDSVTSIGAGAFSGCTALASVIIPDSVTSIGSRAFYNCGSLNKVFYKGTAEQWTKISIANDNTNLTSATHYYYSDTEPDLNADGTAYNGNYWHYDTDGTTIIIWKKEN